MFTYRALLAGAMVALSALFAAPAVLAAQVQAPATTVLHIDEGFLGHPVTFHLFNDSVRLSWNAGDVLGPGDVTVTQVSSTAVTIEWSTSYVLGPKGIAIGFRAPTTTSPFDVIALQTKKPFGNWQTPPATSKDGFVMTRVGAESEVRLAASPQGMRQGSATWYKYKHCNCAASPDFPKGTKLVVTLQGQPAKAVIVTVNDFGPDRNLFPNRVIDLDAVAFKQLSPLSAGLVRVIVQPLILPNATGTTPVVLAQK